MRKLLLSASLFACVAISGVNAQVVPDKTTPGYVVGLKKDTTKGFIVVTNKLARQNKITFYTKLTDVKTKKVYDANLIKAYSVDDVVYEAIPYFDSKNAGPMNFAIVVIIGKISLYNWYTLSTETTITHWPKPDDEVPEKELELNPLVRKGVNIENINVLKYTTNFKKNFAELVMEYKDLAKKIENKELGRKDLEVIIESYNKWATVKKRH